MLRILSLRASRRSCNRIVERLSFCYGTGKRKEKEKREPSLAPHECLRSRLEALL